MSRRGQPTKLNPQTQRKICEALAGGNTRATACLCGGIDRSTFCNWINWGQRARKGKYFQFFRAVKKAEAEASLRNVAVIQSAAQGGQVLRRITRTKRNGDVVVTEKFAPPVWQAAAWWLERRHPEDWGRDSRLIRELMKKQDELMELVEQLRALER